MRTIKFRGKTDTGEWAYGLIPETFGQFTGLFDINGKEIYEGDIISFADGYATESGYCEGWGCVGEVFWDKEEAAFCVTGRYSCESYEALADCKVIGNIYDTPELLEE